MLTGPIENYTFQASTPTEELEVMCRMLTEVGGYASTFADRAHAALARRCESVQRKVERELIRREGKDAVDNLYATPEGPIDATDLSALSIDQLEQLFRQRPTRIKARLAEGRDISTRHFETSIVNELNRRQSATPLEQLKKDYCLRINRQEQDSLGHLTQAPIGQDSYDPALCTTPEALAAAIKRLQDPKTVMEREALQQYIDQSIDLLKTITPRQKGAPLAVTLIVAGWKGQKTATWLKDYLAEALKDWKKHPELPATKMVLPLLTAYQETRDASYRRQAQRIINRSYRAVTSPDAQFIAPSDFIDHIYIALKCCEYVTRFSLRKVRAAWDEFCGKVDVKGMTMLTMQKIISNMLMWGQE